MKSSPVRFTPTMVTPCLLRGADSASVLCQGIPEDEWKAFAEDSGMPDELAALFDEWLLSLVPVGRELMWLIEERGWAGWSRLERTRN